MKKIKGKHIDEEMTTDLELAQGLANKQDNLGFTPENSANKNQPNGYAGLDSEGKVPSSLLPSFSGEGSSVDAYTKTESDANYEPKNTNIQAHISNNTNPHNTTKIHVGLENVQNVDQTNPENIVQNSNYRFVSDLQKQYWDNKLDQDSLFTLFLDTNTIGEVKYFSGPIDTNHFLAANGDIVSRIIFADLFAKIGTTYGAGDGVSTFKLPDLRGVFPRGLDNGRGLDAGRTLGSYQGDAIRNIQGSTGVHATGAWNTNQSGNPFFWGGPFANMFSGVSGNNQSYGWVFDASRQVPTASENRPVNVALNVGIRFKAANEAIITPTETFSTDTAALQYASSSSYNLTTLTNAPVGTYITFTYAANTNTRTQTTTRPTQTDADMNANGMLIYTRPYNTSSSAAQPAAIAIQIGKGLKGINLGLYKNAAKTTAGSLDTMYLGVTERYGLQCKDYNESTGILVLDGALNGASVTSATFTFSDTTLQSSGYLVINASKNPALTGFGLNRVAARAVHSNGQSIPRQVFTTLIWDAVKTFDTHNALNTSTGTFTSPETGYYQLNVELLTNTGTWSAGNYLQLKCLINGSTHIHLDRKEIEATRDGYYNLQGSDVIYLKKDDTFVIQMIHDRSSAIPIIGGASFNYFSIIKVSL